MLTSFDVYVVTEMDSIIVVLGLLSFIIGITGFINVMRAFMFDSYHQDKNNIRVRRLILKKVNYYFLVSFLVLVVATILPSTNQLIAMYVMPNLANSTIMKQLPSEIQKYITDYLERNTDDASKS